MITDTEREIFRRMQPTDKLNLASQLHMQARAGKKAALRSQHKDWTVKQVDQRVREVFLYATTKRDHGANDIYKRESSPRPRTGEPL